MSTSVVLVVVRLADQLALARDFYSLFLRTATHRRLSAATGNLPNGSDYD